MMWNLLDKRKWFIIFGKIIVELWSDLMDFFRKLDVICQYRVVPKR